MERGTVIREQKCGTRQGLGGLVAQMEALCFLLPRLPFPVAHYVLCTLDFIFPEMYMSAHVCHFVVELKLRHHTLCIKHNLIHTLP